ncbi:MAG: LytTR family DNA-binding domain-containing protein [Suipraeoptans sp.]
MKIRIELDENITEEEVVIKVKSYDERIIKIQRHLADVMNLEHKITLYKGDTSYYIPLENILFFETEGNMVYSHTAKEVYVTKSKLYELEEELPGHFMRVSKSTILNVKKVYSMTVTLPSTRLVEFQSSHKQVYVSRYYYKPLQIKLGEVRN